MLGETVACGAFLKYEQINLLQAYIRSPLVTFKRHHTHLEEKKRVTHISNSF
jgi:hypothetical protein